MDKNFFQQNDIDGMINRSVFNMAPVAIGITKFEDGTLIDINDIYADFIGLPREKILGKTTKDLGIWIEPADR